MVDSRAKGARAEAALKKVLVGATGEQWERIPASGALDAVHGLKGDLYIPNKDNKYCVEAKSFKDSAINHNLVSGVGKPLLEWVEQAIRQGKQVNKKPLLMFKHDRSKWFVCFWDEPEHLEKYILYQYDSEELPVYLALLSNWLKQEDITWVKNS
jgi:hypothetical protein